MLWKETQTCSKIVYLSTDFVFDLIEIIYFNPKLVKACLYIHVGITGACIYGSAQKMLHMDDIY